MNAATGAIGHHPSQDVAEFRREAVGGSSGVAGDVYRERVALAIGGERLRVGVAREVRAAHVGDQGDALSDDGEPVEDLEELAAVGDRDPARFGDVERRPYETP